MFPHYFGFDFSAALPWLIMGFVAGTLFIGLTRWLSGGGKQVQATIQGLHDQLSSSRLTASRLESDIGFLNTALADAERRAAASSDMARENARLAKSEADSRKKLETLAGEITRVRQELTTQSSNGSNFEAEVQRLKAENASLKSSWDNNAQQFSKMRNELSEAEMKLRDFDLIKLKLAESERTVAEAETVKSQLEKTRSQFVVTMADLDKMRAEFAALKEQTANSGVVADSSGGEEISALKSDLEKTRADLAAANTSLAAANASLAAAKAKQPDAGSAGGGVPTGQYNAVMTDLTATRNLSIVQARELKHLRAEVARLAETQSSGGGMSYADAPMSGRYTDRPLVSKRSAGIRSRFRGWRKPGGVEGEIAMLRAKVEQQEEELRRLTKRDD